MSNQFYFEKFQYYIVGLFAEVLNDIEQHSYQKLTDKWWFDVYTEIRTMLEKPDANKDDIQKVVLEKVLNEFPKDMIKDDQLVDLKKTLERACKDYYYMLYPICYCGHDDCEWDCGVLWCGCIDVCRGRCGLRDRERYR